MSTPEAASAPIERYIQLQEEPMYPLRSPASLQAAWWALRAVARTRRDLRRTGLEARVSSPPALPWGSRNGVNVVLGRLSPTCLERAVIMQEWLAAHDVLLDVVVGVRRGAEAEVGAHAWVDQLTAPAEYESYAVIHRIVPRR